MDASDFRGKRVAVIGLGRTGVAVAEALCALSAHVQIYDCKSRESLGDVTDRVQSAGAELHLGSDEVDVENIDLLIPSPGVPRTHPSLLKALNAGVEIISEIELAYRIARCPIIAVTGTNGKTTTTVLTGLMLAADGRKTYVAGNVAGARVQSDVGICEGPMPLVTAAAKADSDSVIVAEVSTFQLEWIKSFRPTVAALLNISCDHLDRHADLREYAALKARIFENQKPNDCAVVNADNTLTAEISRSLQSRVLLFSRVREVAEGSFLRGDSLVVRLEGREEVICSRAEILIPGAHNLENVLAASCAAVAFGVSPISAARAVRSFRGVEHRLETVAVIDGVRYVNNSMCTNVEAAVRSTEAIEAPQIVIAGGKDKGSDFGPLVEAFKRKAKHVILIGADADVIMNAARRAGFERMSQAPTLEDAVAQARSLAEPGDVVILNPACASFDMFESFEHRGKVFRDIVLSYKESTCCRKQCSD
ncbi:MAG: UDP-N-acetylmuramoyl-L-alanine--D-glutamate ligase [Armatimonadota bacterium]|nr:UDP-N-acetylmuramoyl-L-alanine--D-glutamate ligase [Armatimonadota bacterium]